ncbi:FAD-dependent oxidoreductase [Sphingomonas sp. 35-24ZXX]|uniref:FAD-dependent oxidoreductase n=1 Tax=Sphingomonas sp. 35-24ZXX TaxID=1545915 RepID=UPI00053BE00A|nr:FAD-dependent monooxygenase [Sphingomonas sp. 35-24ZXX]
MVETTRRTQVVVAGAGPVGAVAATWLAKQGIDVILAEAGADAAQDLRASTFHPPTLEMLSELGITDRLVEIGLKAPVYHWRDRASGETIAFDLTELSDITQFPYRLQCEQYHLARMLSDGLANMRTGEVLFDHRLAYFEQDDTGVDVFLESPMGIEKVRADYLIGADGASSIARKWLNIEFDGFTYPERFLTLSTDYPIEQAMQGVAYVNYVSDPDEWLVLLRVPKLWRVLVPAQESDPQTLLSDATKNAVFDRIMGDGAQVRTEHRTIYRVHQRVAKKFRDGRVMLVGDAAHLNNPLGGFGMNSGIHDAVNLCQKLTVVLGGQDAAADEQLARYDRQRRTVTYDFTQSQTIENMELMRGGQSEAHERRRDALRKVAADPALRRAYLLRQAMYESLDQAAAIE